MTPVQPSTVTPAGRDPENTDTTALLSSVGVNEKDNPSPMIKLVSGKKIYSRITSSDTSPEADPTSFLAVME